MRYMHRSLGLVTKLDSWFDSIRGLMMRVECNGGGVTAVYQSDLTPITEVPIPITVYNAFNESDAWRDAQNQVEGISTENPFELVLIRVIATRNCDEWNRVYHFEVQFV